jgi:hypothetical protein
MADKNNEKEPEKIKILEDLEEAEKIIQQYDEEKIEIFSPQKNSGE